jgi:hypothetical protein
MTKTFKRLAPILALLAILVTVLAACNDDDDDEGDGDASATATTAAADGGSATPTLAPQEATFCQGEALEDAVETLYQSLKLSAEAEGLTVGNDEGLRNDSRAAIEHLCAAPTPFQTEAYQVYCEDLQVAIDNNIEGDEAAKQAFMESYRAASCPTPTPVP